MQAVNVECRNIALSYGATTVLRDINLAIAPGEFFALLGPSGSGKSTLLRLIAGFAVAQSGSVSVDGRDITNTPPWQRNIGMVFQNYALWPHMTVAANVAFGLEERRWPRDRINAKVIEMLRLVGLDDLGHRRPNELSGGQQQRVALARTLAIEPTVLLLDEPLSNLDAKLRVQMRQELKALQRRLSITTIFVTHDQEEALTTCDRIAVMDQGIIQQIGTPIDLFDRPANRFVAHFVGTINFIRGTARRTNGSHIEFSAPAIGAINLHNDGTLTQDGQAELAIRPHAIRLGTQNTGATDAEISVSARILESEFLGDVVRYRIAIDGHEWLADQPHQPGKPVLAPGSAVHAAFGARDCRLLPA